MRLAPAADRDPDQAGVCGAWGPMQGRRDPVRCQVHAGHEGRHYAYTDDGERGPRWRGEYIPLEAPNGEVFFTLPPEGRRGRLPAFYRQHPQWTRWREIHERGLVQQACRKHGIGTTPDLDGLLADQDDDADDAPTQPPATEPSQQTPSQPLCAEVDELEERHCRGWWLRHSDELASDVVHVCHKRGEHPHEGRCECVCGVRRKAKSYGPLEATKRPEEELEAFA